MSAPIQGIEFATTDELLVVVKVLTGTLAAIERQQVEIDKLKTRCDYLRDQIDFLDGQQYVR